MPVLNKQPEKKALKKLVPRLSAPEPTVPVHAEYHDAYPRAEGPPPVSAGSSAALFDCQTGFVTVSLDAGAFRMMWELAEREAKARWETRPSLAYARAAERAVVAMRKAWERRPPA